MKTLLESIYKKMTCSFGKYSAEELECIKSLIKGECKTPQKQTKASKTITESKKTVVQALVSEKEKSILEAMQANTEWHRQKDINPFENIFSFIGTLSVLKQRGFVETSRIGKEANVRLTQSGLDYSLENFNSKTDSDNSFINFHHQAQITSMLSGHDVTEEEVAEAILNCQYWSKFDNDEDKIGVPIFYSNVEFAPESLITEMEDKGLVYVSDNFCGKQIELTEKGFNTFRGGN